MQRGRGGGAHVEAERAVLVAVAQLLVLAAATRRLGAGGHGLAVAQLALGRPRREHGRVDGQRRFREVGVLERIFGGDALRRVVRQKALQHIEAGVRQHIEPRA